MRGWFHSAYRLLMQRAHGQRPTVQRESVFRIHGSGDAIALASARNAQTLQCSAGTECGYRPAAESLAREDWDLMFRAALELLARVAAEKSMPLGPGVRLQAPGTVLRECVEALDQLRRSLPTEQFEQTEQTEQSLRALRARCEITPAAIASGLSRPA